MVPARFQSPNLNLGCVHPYKVEGIIQIIQPVAQKALDLKLTACMQPSLCWLKSWCQFGIPKALPDFWVKILPLPLWQIKDGHKFFDTFLMERWGPCHSPSESVVTLWQLWPQRYKSDHVPVSGPGLRKYSFHLSLWACSSKNVSETLLDSMNQCSVAISWTRANCTNHCWLGHKKHQGISTRPLTHKIMICNQMVAVWNTKFLDGF